MPDPTQVWRSVLNEPALLDRATRINPQNVADLAKLRRDYDAHHITIALQLVAARQKLQPKFGEQADRMAADIPGAEQASSLAVGIHKAKRYRKILGEHAEIYDLCCGIGGDAIGLLAEKLHVTAVDLDPLRVWMTSHNTAGATQTRCADVDGIDIQDQAIHLDPARRDETDGRRTFKLDDYRPGPATIEKLLNRSRAAGIKLGPGIDLDTLPWPGEIEFISDRGRLVQAVLWTGLLEQYKRSATLLTDQHTHTLAGDPAEPTLGPLKRHIYTVDPAAERAGLLGLLTRQLNIAAVHPKLGLLTCDNTLTSPWLTGFEVLESLPWRQNKVKQWLSANDAGIIEVKTRGKAVDPDPVARDLRGKGTTPYTVFIHRWDQRKLALITRRL